MIKLMRAMEQAILNLIAIENERSRTERRFTELKARRIYLTQREEELTNSADLLIKAMTEVEAFLSNSKKEAVGGTN